MSCSYRARVIILCGAGILGSNDVIAAQVRGTVDAPLASSAGGLILGYTRTRVAQRAKDAAERADVAVIMMAKESGVIPPASEPYKVLLSGLAMKPAVSACVIDGKIAFTNSEKGPVTIEIGDRAIGAVAPGQTLTYECKSSDLGTRRVRVKEWPHVRGSLFVGEIGVVSPVNANGAFS